MNPFGEDREAQGVLPVSTLEDLSRADLGNTHVVRMVVHEELAGKAKAMFARVEGPEEGEKVAPGEAGSPFHNGGDWKDATATATPVPATGHDSKEQGDCGCC